MLEKINMILFLSTSTGLSNERNNKMIHTKFPVIWLINGSSSSIFPRLAPTRSVLQNYLRRQQSKITFLASSTENMMKIMAHPRYRPDLPPADCEQKTGEFFP